MIKSTSKFYLLSILSIAFVLLLSPLAVADAQIVPCGGPGQDSCTIYHLFTLLLRIYNFLLGMSAFVALIFIIWGGVQMFSPNQDGVQAGKKTVTYAISGLVIILVAYLTVNTLLVVLSGNSKNLENSITLPK